MAFLKLQYWFTALLLGLAVLAAGTGCGTRKENGMKGAGEVTMGYKIEGAFSPYQYIAVEVGGNGAGMVRYKLYAEYRREGDPSGEKTVDILLSPAETEALKQRYNEMDFFRTEIPDLNKPRTQVTDMGTTTLSYRASGQSRDISYGFTQDARALAIVETYSSLIDRTLPPARELKRTDL